MLTAASLKGYGLARDPLAQDEVLPNRTTAILAVLFELGLGSWLLVGVFPSVARPIAIVCFTTFLIVSISHILAGKASCGCFGAIQVTPWVTTIFDTAIVGLLIGLPSPDPKSGEQGRALFTAGLVMAIAVPGFWLMCPAPSPTPLTVSPEAVEFPQVYQGQRAEAEVLVTNPSQAEIEIHTVETSCPCLTVNLAKNQIGKGETVPAIVVLDLAQEPNFIGSLGITAKGLSGTNQTVFQFLIHLTVLSKTRKEI